MKYDADKHHRRSIRLREYDYSSTGANFVTICAQNRTCLFGAICDGIMQLNGAGQMVAGEWQDLVERFPGIDLDEYVVMPNHFHGILVINNPPRVGASLVDAQPRPTIRNGLRLSCTCGSGIITSTSSVTRPICNTYVIM